MKVVINKDYGGFGLSEKACELLGKDQYFYYPDEKRCDPELVRVVEMLGDEASGIDAELGIVEIPDDVEWQIGTRDGKEWVAEKHWIWD